MIPFQIGNWKITNDSIYHVNHANYVIPRDRLLEAGPGDRVTMFDWLVHMPTKTWCSTEDIYSLNTAFIYAVEAWELTIPNDMSFRNTFIEQENELNNR